MDFRTMTTLQKEIWGGVVVAWIVCWNLFLFLMKKRSDKLQTAMATASTSPNSPGYAPPKMKVASGAILHMDANTPAGVAPVQNPGQAQAPMAAPRPAAITPDTLLEKDLAELSNGFWGDLDLGCFTHVMYEGMNIDLVYSSDDCAVVVHVLSEDGAWMVDPSTGNFINGTTIKPAPVAVLKQQVASLQKIEEGAKIVPVLLLMRGMIQNQETVLPYLQQNGIVFAKYSEAIACPGPTLAQVLKENFQPVATPMVSNHGWEELDEREELEMLRTKQEVNYEQESKQQEPDHQVGSQENQQ
jgi:hypothetical protein